MKGFKAFIMKGNIMDLAVGVIIGGAFGKIVASLVNDILMPLIGLALGQVDFSALSWQVGNATVMYGQFIQNVVDFLIIALCIYLMISALAKFKKKEEEKPAEPVEPTEEVKLLTEIRDLLKK